MEFKQKDPDPSGIKDRMLVRLQNQQSRLIARSYWGRSTLYKQLIHISIIVITTIVLATGLNARTSSANTEIAYQNPSAYQNVDTLEQGGFVTTEFIATDNFKFKVNSYTVADGDSVQSIADKFGVTKETVKWSNPVIDYYNESISPGSTLFIPEINGVLWETKEGDTIDYVLSKTSGDRFLMIEINDLNEANQTLASGTKIFVPGGNLPPPPKPAPVYYAPVYSGVPCGQSAPINADGGINGITLTNPVGDSCCGGYVETRGAFTAFGWDHDGTDLSKGGGCPIRASASGYVEYAGWGSYGEGMHVKINHANGVKTYYYHLNDVWVSQGQQVSMGQNLGYMGCTGNCTGTHLHFILKLDGSWQNPRSFLNY
jgi:murein DD-endopeptidase MepM/ murein hydrolase activator NlpD